MHRISFIICIVLIMVYATTSNALEIGVLGYFSIPVGDFASTTSEYAGYADIGYGAGLELAVPIDLAALIGMPPELGSVNIIGQARVIFNPSDNSTLQEQFYNEMEWYWYLGWDMELMTLSMDAGKYVNIPLMGGASLEIVANPNITFFCKGLAGINFSMFPDYEFPMTVYDSVDDQYYAVNAVADSDGTGVTYCLSAGAGAIINDTIELGFEYLYLGEPEIDGNISIWSGDILIDSVDGTFIQNISMMNLSIGIRF